MNQFLEEMNPNPVVETFSKNFPLSDQAKNDFNSIINFDVKPRKTKLLEFGKIASNLYLIHKGLARAYYFRNGTEFTYYFAIDNQFIGSVPGIIDGKPSHHAIELLEVSEVYSFSYENFERCCSIHPDLETASRKLTTMIYIREQLRTNSLRFHTTRERYEQMDEKFPGITNRCPLKYIASYIGTSQVSLSRIRAGIQ